MKKRFLVAAMAATLVSPLAAQADATVYGNVHLSIDSYDSDVDGPQMNSNTSSIGVKGKEDLGGGMSAIFKVEFQVDPSERNSGAGSSNTDPTDSDFGAVKTKTALVDRDQWVGLKGAMGTVKFGTMSNNYKQMGGKIDPMYRTQLEGRGFMDTQSKLHSGAGKNGGRSTNTLQYSSPKMGGMQMVFNYTFSGEADETLGLGVHYKTKTIIGYIDYLDVQGVGTNGGSEAAFKVGGSYKMGAMTVGLQFESVEDVINSGASTAKPGDTIFASFNYQVTDAGNVAFTVGDNDTDDVGYALMYNHKLSKRTNTYVGYGDNASDKAADDQVFTLGIRHKF